MSDMTDVIVSDVPPSCLDRAPVMLGIDEAGRGPVLGPMVYGCAYWAESDDEACKKLGFDDSKALSEARREALFAKMRTCGRVGYVTISISARDISRKMLRRVPYSLNAVSHDAAIELVRTVLARGVNVTRVFVDTVGDAGSYERKLDAAFQHRIAFTVCSKADSLYKTVSAASIAAKVTRDLALRAWRFDEPVLQAAADAAAAAAAAAPGSRAAAAAAVAARDDGDESGGGGGGGGETGDSDDGNAAGGGSGGGGAGTKRRREGGGVRVAATADAAPQPPARIPHPRTAGSGYPGDATCKAWLRHHMDAVFGWPSMLRFSWSTSRDLLGEGGAGGGASLAAPVAWEDDEKDTAAPDEQQPKVTAFFAAKSAAVGAGGAGGGGGGVPGSDRHAFFRQRRLEAVGDV